MSDPAARWSRNRNPLPLRVVEATTFLARLRGLLGRKALPRDQALYLAPCSGVHTVGMRFPIDVVFLSPSGLVVDVVPELPPGRFSTCREAAAVLELAAGRVAELGIEVGDRLARIG